MTVAMVVSVVMAVVNGRQRVVAAGPPQHPQRHADHDDARGELEIGFELFAADPTPEVHPAERDDPDDEGVGDRRAKAEQDRLFHGPPGGDDERRHHRSRMTRLQAVERAEQDGA